MSLLGIIETLRRNLKAVIVASCVVLALLVAADVVRLMTASGEHHGATSEHTAAPAAEHAATPAHAGAQAVPDAAVAVFGEHATEEAGFHEEAPSHGFWFSLYHIAENVPGFWTAFGFLGCILLVVVSKTYGHAGVSEREDYYGE